MTRTPGLIALLLLIASPQPLSLPPRCFPAEHWDVAIKALGVTGAHARVDVDGECGTTPASVRAEVETTRLVSFVWRIHDTLVTEMAPSGASVSTTFREDENEHADARVDRYAEGKVTTTWTTRGKERTVEVTAPPGTLDPLSVLMLLRGAVLANGEVYRVPIFSKDAVYDGTVLVVGRETASFHGRAVRAIHLRATFLKDAKPSAVYAEIDLSDDALRLPLRVEAGTRYGHLVATLSDATHLPAAPTSPSAWQ